LIPRIRIDLRWISKGKFGCNGGFTRPPSFKTSNEYVVNFDAPVLLLCIQGNAKAHDRILFEELKTGSHLNVASRF